jgi:hypothetical protein
MAGGVHAAAMPCWECGDRADRTAEGMEDDWYRVEPPDDPGGRTLLDCARIPRPEHP